MNKNIFTIALLFLMLFMISCSAEDNVEEEDTHTNTISRVNSAANISQAGNYVFSDEPEEIDNELTLNKQQEVEPVTEPVAETILDTAAEDNITEAIPPEKTTTESNEDKYKGLYTSIYDKVPPIETKIFIKETKDAEEAKKAKAKEQAKKPEQRKKGTIIGNFKTFFNAANKPRVANIKKAANKLNGAEIKPGRVFSFNRYIGPTGEANGYKPSTVIVQGKETKGFGGGVCQVSSTLFNACDEAGMEILERHSHSKKVPYLPEGRDAAISYGGVDFKFKNTKDYTVRLKASVNNGTIVVSVEKI